jgi:hypothetical protein
VAQGRAVEDTDLMAGRLGPVETIRAQAPAAFGFLAREWGFAEPVPIDEGLVWHRPGLVVEVRAWTRNHERGFDTRLVDTRDDHMAVESLDRLYTECGLGPAQDVPEQSGTGHVIAKRIRQHATALALVMPHLADPASAQALFHRCRSTPSGS